MEKKEFKKIIESVQLTSPVNKKKFYSITDLVFDFKICSFEEAKLCAENIRAILQEISFPTRSTIQFVKNNKNGIDKIFVNIDGLMLILAVLAKNLKDKNKKAFCYNIAKYIRINKEAFYPEKRILNRREYSDVTKEFRSAIKYFYGDIDKYELSRKIALVYHSIIKGYYGIDDYEELNYIKTGSVKSNYLDYITTQELRDLINIQNEVINAIKTDSRINIINYTKNIAEEYKVKFCSRATGVFPKTYKAHKNKPMKCLKDFYKFLKEYNLDAESINFNVTDLTKEM